MSKQVNNNELWVEKYRPKKLTDYFMNKIQLDTVKNWITNFIEKNEDAKPFLVLYGSTGIGKTTLAHLILEKYGFEVIECNASDTRSKKTLNEMLGTISKYSICSTSSADISTKKANTIKTENFKPVGIIMDEIDGLSGGDVGGVQELMNIAIQKNRHTQEMENICPVICTTNSVKEKKLLPIIKNGVVLCVNRPTNVECNKLLDLISKNENYIFSLDSRNNIINNANGDYRQLIYLAYEDYLSSKMVTIVSPPEKSEQMEKWYNDSSMNDDDGDHYLANKLSTRIGDSPLDKINYFLTNNTDIDTIKYICSGDSNVFYLNLYYNVISINYNILSKKFPGAKTKEELHANISRFYNIFKNINRADVFNENIFNDKNWDLLPYFDYIGMAYPIKMMSNLNISSNNSSNNSTNDNKSVLVKKFELGHHTPYNFMRQEQNNIKKKLAIDYTNTNQNDIFSIYYNLKRFQKENKEKIENATKLSKTKKSKAAIGGNGIYLVDKSYLKIITKLEELLT